MFLKSGICQSQDNANGPNIATMSEVQDGKHRMDHDSFCVAVDISSGEHRQLFFSQRVEILISAIASLSDSYPLLTTEPKWAT